MASTPAPRKAPPKKPPAKKPAARKSAAGIGAPAKKKPVAPKPKPAPTKAIKIDSSTDNADKGLTPKQQRFVDEYMVDLNATQAAIRAGYSAHTANEQGSRLLANVSVQAAISIARKAQQERTGITADRVLTEIALVAFADARELVEVRKGCCRHCWGEGFKRQRTVGEMNAAVEQWRKDGKDPADFDQEGGIGYNPHRPPHPDCPDCVGEGHARTVIKDTRSLTPAAVALYAGAKETKYGIEVLSHSKMDAVEKLAKHVGLYEKDNQQKADPLSALLTRIAQGNGNGFAPVQNDPERTTSAGLPMKAQVQDDDED
ncbi:terminase small subunit [Acidovorax sp. RAC01]|nr:terminase small subunit [Acidovorax sp. RAC01]AOG25102.1 terminase small subunit [Acidovorax sp. RAC01]